MKYGLKALIDIVNKTGPFVPASDIASKNNIPIKFLEQILSELKKHDIIQSKKGSTGGYFLAKEPHDISLADIYRILEGPIALVTCASLNFYLPCEDCPDEGSCTIHHALVKVRDETLTALNEITLADLASKDFKVISKF